jgi:Ca2+-binding EF-hand superfamily protein
MQSASLLAADNVRTWLHFTSQLRLGILDKGDPPEWFQPDFLHKKHRHDLTACTLECPVCCFELWRLPVAVLRNHSKRSCSHYIHYECGVWLVSQSAGTGQQPLCITCAESFSEVKQLPDVFHRPKEWFTLCDASLNGTLDRLEVMEGIGSCFPCSKSSLEREVSARWDEWDVDDNGSIDIDEFLRPHRGLHSWLVNSVQQLSDATVIGIAAAPVLDRTPREWFSFWDTDQSGCLDKEELRRALVRSLCVTDQGAPLIREARDMKLVVDSLWIGMGYTAIESIEFEEFARPYGLLDQTLHNTSQCTYFGEDEEYCLPKEAEVQVMEWHESGAVV